MSGGTIAWKNHYGLAADKEKGFRFAVSDNPMPDDSMDQVSLHSGVGSPTVSRDRAGSHLKVSVWSFSFHHMNHL